MLLDKTAMLVAKENRRQHGVRLLNSSVHRQSGVGISRFAFPGGELFSVWKKTPHRCYVKELAMRDTFRSALATLNRILSRRRASKELVG